MIRVIDDFDVWRRKEFGGDILQGTGSCPGPVINDVARHGNR